jgi:hypothetical protein
MTDYKPFGKVQEGVDHQTLRDNREWVEASLRLYEVNHGTLPSLEDLGDYDGDDLRTKIADYGLVQMAGFNFNIVDQAIDTHTITQKGDQQTKEAFVYLLDQYDEVNTSWKTAGDATWEMATDATNWLGLATAGTGAVVAQAAKFAGKKAVKKKIKGEIKKSLGKTAALTGFEGAAHGAAFDVMDQSVRLDAGSQEEFSAGQTALSAGIGFAAGATIGTGIDMVAARLGSKKAQKSAEKLAEDDVKVAEELAEMEGFEARLEGKQAREGTEEVVDGTPQPKAEFDADEQVEWIGDIEYNKVSKKIDEDVAAEPRTDSFSGQKFGALVLRDARDLVKIRTDDVIAELHVNPDFVDDVIKRIEDLEVKRSVFSTLVREFNMAEAYFAKIDLKLYEIINNPKSSARQIKEAEALQGENQQRLVKAFFGAKHLNSYSGRDLNAAKLRQKIEVDKDGNISDEARAIAYENQQLKNIKEVELKYNADINKLLSTGDPKDTQKAINLMRQRDDEAAFIKAKIIGEGKETVYDQINKRAEKYVELSISGVFSPSTVIINTVFPMLKNYTYPLLDQIVNNPMSLTKWRRMVKVYGHMFAAQEAARKSFQAAYQFEQTLLTKDVSRFLGEGIKVKGKLAAHLRTFPRLLGATDAYNQELAAAGYVAGDAFDRLLTQGMKKKLKGDKLKKFIDDKIKDEVAKAYDEKLTIEALTPLYEKGRALNLEGDALDKYVLDNINKFGTKTFRRLGNDRRVKELRTQAEMLREQGERAEALKLDKEATDLENIGANARDYVETLLYKKEFEGGKTGIAGAMESGAKKIEELHKAHPIAKIFGQLFFRTPAWVFHESMRLTPAVNVMLPQFRNDLAGLNGVGRQARAQTEATLAFSLMMYVTTKWAQGEITGSANIDYTMTGEQETDGLGALSIQIGDEGKHFDYRRYEPLRIPMTIVVNALDGVMATRAREEVGESDPELYDRTLAAMGIGMATFISAFQDSALFTGIVDTFTAGFRMGGMFTSDAPDAKEEAWNVGSDLLLKKALMIVPSIAKKGQVAAGANELTAPVNAQQRILSTFSPNHPSLPRKYDIFGNVRKLDNPMTVLNPFWYSTPEQRVAGRSEKEMAVHRWINELEQSGFGNFTRAKFKSSKYPVADLREERINYKGMEVSVYDAMMAELNSPAIKKPLIQELYNLSISKDSLGNPEEREKHSYRVTDAKKAIRQAKEDALDEVLGNPKSKIVGQDLTLSQVIEQREVEVQKAKDGIFK